MERNAEDIRVMDIWLRRMAILGPITAFVLGWGSGILSAAILYKDHEKRIQTLETYREGHTRWAAEMVEKNNDRMVDLEYATGLRSKRKGN